MTRPLRVYLDTAIILERADDRIDPALNRRLDEAISSKNAQMVFSLGHFWDIHASASERDRDRAIATIQSLVNRRVVIDGPLKVERPRLDGALRGDPVDARAIDITVAPISDFGAAMADSRDFLKGLGEVGAMMAHAENLSRQAGRSEAFNPVVKANLERLLSGETIAQVTQGFGVDGAVETAAPQLLALDTQAASEFAGHTRRNSI